MSHEDELAGESQSTDPAPLSRRTLLQAGVAAMGEMAMAGALMSPVMRLATTAATAAPSIADRFMTASHLLIQHRLSFDVGSRMASALGSLIPTFDADLEVIVGVAREKQAKVVEDFFDALPDGHVRETAHRIIFGWYAGVLDESPKAEVFAYEEALMYQPTRDAVALPTYSFNGPDNWTDIDPPLSAMPEF